MKRSFVLVAVAGAFALTGIIIACGSDPGTGPGTTNTDVGAADVKGTMSAGFAVNSITLPQQKSDFAYDLIGDGHMHNQLGNIIGTLTTQNLDAQSGVDQSVQTGVVSVLLSVKTSDPTLKTDEPIQVTFYLGKNLMGMQARNDAGLPYDGGACTNCPSFTGMGMFTVDASQPGGDFFGKLKAGHFSSNPPVTTKTPVTITLKVALIADAPPISLIINGAHVQFDVVAGPGGKPALMGAQLHGSIKNKDIQNSIIPAVATLLSMRLKADPNSSSSKQIASIFDTGGCMNPDGTMAKMNDMKIDTCEVAQNSIIMAVLAPDVQIYDANGNYAPNKLNTMKDSLSLGLSFTAVSGTVSK